MAILVFLLLSIFALKDLAIPNFYSSHDGETHTARMAQYFGALADGQFPPRIAGSLYNGLGSPIFVYIYPLPYILGSVVHTLGASFTDSFEILMAAGFILSGIFSYLWLKELFGSPRAALAGALFYTWVPYRFLLIYVRGSISENLAYTFLPAVFWALTKLIKTPTLIWTALTALFFALFLASQTLVVVMALPLIGVYILFIVLSLIDNPDSRFRGNDTRKEETSHFVRRITYVFISLVWGFLMVAFTYLPSLFERDLIRLDEVYSLSYKDHFPSLGQVLYSPWDYGFSVSGFTDAISFQLGLAHWLVLGLFILVVAKKFFRSFVRLRRTQDDDKGPLFLAVIFALAGIISIMLMIPTKLTLYLWENVKTLSLIDLPWRFLGPAVLALSVVTAYTVKSIKPGLAFLFLVLAVVVANRNHLRINQTLVFPDEFFQNYTGTATHLGEFTPTSRGSTKTPLEIRDKYKIIAGDITIQDFSTRSNEISFIADVQSDSAQVRINKFYFPEMALFVDGERQPPDQIAVTDNTIKTEETYDTTGLVLASLPNGAHQVKIKYQETRLRMLANYLSLGAIAIALLMVVRTLLLERIKK